MSRLSTMIRLGMAGFLSLGPATQADAETLEFLAGSVGGGWYNLAVGLSGVVHAAAPGLTLKTVPGGGVSNPSKLDAGIGQIGFVQSIFGVAARNGGGPFEGRPHRNLRLVLGGLADNYLHMLKPAGDPATMKEILTTGGRSIGIAPSGSTDEYSFRFAMDHYGISYDALRDTGKVVHAGYLDLASAFRDGQIDYVFVLLGLPGGMVSDAAQGRDLALVPFPDLLRDPLAAKWGYARKPIPAGTYEGQATDVPALVTSTSLYASADVADETIHAIVEAICEAPAATLTSIAAALDGFSCADAAGDGIVPLHPGAAAYLREAGHIE